MDYRQAFNILELKPNFTKHELKKYYQLLKFHVELSNILSFSFITATSDTYLFFLKTFALPPV